MSLVKLYCVLVLAVLIWVPASGQTGTSSYVGLDLGSGIWLEDGKSPSETNATYSTRPWGSWHIGLNWVNNTQLTGPLYLDWGGGVYWYNWLLEDGNYQFTKGVSSVELTNNIPSGGSSIKSKLSATYVGAYLIPMLDFGKPENRKVIEGISKKGFSDGFRLGIGPYVSYRIGSRSKYVFKDDGQRDRDKIQDHFFLENTRYGFRAQIGVNAFELFFSYDLNEVFAPGSGPDGARLNNLTVGVTFVSDGK